jgi:hypothetical protein
MPNESRKQKLPRPWEHIDDYDTIVSLTAHYIVYVGVKKSLYWQTTDSYDKTFRTNAKFNATKHNLIFTEAAILQAAAKRKEFTSDAVEELLCLNGNALTCVFEVDYEGAQKTLDVAKQFFRERSEEISRSWYILASFVMAFTFIIIGVLVWICRIQFNAWLGTTITWLFLASSAGATGALLSVILRSGKLNFDPSSGRILHYLEGASRIWAGALSGIVVTLAIKSGIFLGTIASAQTNTFVILAAVAAGASERFATSIISKIESASDKGKGLRQK